MLTLSSIHIYPIKSLSGISLGEATVQRRGLQYDRRWMLVDAAGQFVSQREIPAMALVGTAIESPFLTVFSRQNPEMRLQIPLSDSAAGEKIRVQIWSDKCSARLVSREADQWFSDMLNNHLRLVYMPDTTRRRADGRYAPKGHHVSFADGFPFLLIGQASLDDLNSRLALPLPMNRFRPNLVFTGGSPYEEDEWQDFTIGNTLFRGVKPCGRCIITTMNQDTAARAAEPLKTLSTYRKHGNRILFGQNVVWLDETPEAVVRVGDPLHVIPA